MRNFNKIKPLHMESPLLREVPKFELGTGKGGILPTNGIPSTGAYEFGGKYYVNGVEVDYNTYKLHSTDLSNTQSGMLINTSSPGDSDNTSSQVNTSSAETVNTSVNPTFKASEVKSSNTSLPGIVKPKTPENIQEQLQYGVAKAINTLNLQIYDNAVKNAESKGLFGKKKANTLVDNALANLEKSLQNLAAAADQVGLPTLDLTQTSKEAFLETKDKIAATQAGNKAEVFLKASGYAQGAAAVSQAFSSVMPEKKEYSGPKGELAKGLDSSYDAVSDAALLSGNPYAMAAGAAMKVLGVGNQALNSLGAGTDGMTGLDAFLSSNWGFLATGGLSAINGFGGSTTDKFEVDQEIKADIGDAYEGAQDHLSNAADKAGKKYGLLSSSAFGKAQREIAEAKRKESFMRTIRDEARDNTQAAAYEGIGLRNTMALNGGYRSLRAARNGMKISSLLFAKKLALGGGVNFNKFTAIKTPKLENANVDLTDSFNTIKTTVEEPEDLLGKAITEAGGTMYSDEQGNRHMRVASNLLKQYKPSEINEWYLKNHPNVTVDWSLNGRDDADLLNDEWWESNKENFFQNAETQWKSNVPKPSDGAVEALNALQSLIGNLTQLVSDLSTENNTLKQNQEAQAWDNWKALNGESVKTRMRKRENLEDDENALRYALELGYTYKRFGDPKSPDFYSSIGWRDKDGKLFEEDGTPIEGPQDNKTKNTLLELLQKANNGNYLADEERESLKRAGYIFKPGDAFNKPKWEMPSMKDGGIFTFFPATDEEIQMFKAGGAFNVIPEGALHKNKHHMDDAEGLTKKGIPVVTEEEGGELVQQAEIEKEEIILHLALTETLEKMGKDYRDSKDDSIAINAGKLLAEEILHNTIDRAKLIKTIE